MPDQLRAVAAGDPSALRELGERIEREGYVYKVTPVAVRFLVEIAGDRELDREQRLGILLVLARVAAARDADPALLRSILAELTAARDRLGEILDDPDPALSVAVTGLAGRFASPPKAWAPRLRRLRDAAQDPVVRGAYAVALDLAEGRPPDRAAIAAAAEADADVAEWREREASGLLGLRIGPGAAARLAGLLARKAAWRA